MNPKGTILTKQPPQNKGMNPNVAQRRPGAPKPSPAISGKINKNIATKNNR